MEGDKYVIMDCEGVEKMENAFVKLVAANLYKIIEGQPEIVQSETHILSTFGCREPPGYRYCQLLTGCWWGDRKFKLYNFKTPLESLTSILKLCDNAIIFSKGTALEYAFLNGKSLNGVTMGLGGRGCFINDINELGNVDTFDVYVSKKMKRLCVPKNDPYKKCLIGRSNVPVNWMSGKAYRIFRDPKYEYFPPAHDPAIEIAYFNQVIENRLLYK